MQSCRFSELAAGSADWDVTLIEAFVRFPDANTSMGLGVSNRCAVVDGFESGTTDEW